MNRRQFLGLAVFSSCFGQLAAESMPVTAIVLDDGFLSHHISPAHPESPARYQAIIRLLDEQIWRERLLTLRPLALENTAPWLLEVHSETHVKAIEATLSTYQNVLLATGGCLSAVDAVLKKNARNAFCASRPPGHHALNTGQEEGFCYFNHIAVAAKYAQKQYGLKKVLIIDWDYHHGNGTEWAFYEDPSVLFFSTHDQFAYPGTGSPSRTGKGEGEGFNINVHLDCGSGDREMMAAFEQHLAGVARSFKPDLILISAGFDSRRDDLLGCFTVTDQGFYQLTRWVMSLADELCEGRLVSLLEGGYNIPGNASAVVSHLEALSTL